VFSIRALTHQIFVGLYVKWRGSLDQITQEIEPGPIRNNGSLRLMLLTRKTSRR
jgi:hypothetical protein